MGKEYEDMCKKYFRNYNSVTNQGDYSYNASSHDYEVCSQKLSPLDQMNLCKQARKISENMEKVAAIQQINGLLELARQLETKDPIEAQKYREWAISLNMQISNKEKTKQRV